MSSQVKWTFGWHMRRNALWTSSSSALQDGTVTELALIRYSTEAGVWNSECSTPILPAHNSWWWQLPPLFCTLLWSGLQELMCNTRSQNLCVTWESLGPSFQACMCLTKLGLLKILREQEWLQHCENLVYFSPLLLNIVANVLWSRKWPLSAYQI